MKRRKRFAHVCACARKAGIKGGRRKIESLGFSMETLEDSRKGRILFAMSKLGFNRAKAVAYANDTIETMLWAAL